MIRKHAVELEHEHPVGDKNESEYRLTLGGETVVWVRTDEEIHPAQALVHLLRFSTTDEQED